MLNSVFMHYTALYCIVLSKPIDGNKISLFYHGPIKDESESEISFLHKSPFFTNMVNFGQFFFLNKKLNEEVEKDCNFLESAHNNFYMR